MGAGEAGEDVGAAEAFGCPRCGRAAGPATGERFYGPCTACREELRATLGGREAGEFVRGRVEPKMNVVPNQVATKD